MKKKVLIVTSNYYEQISSNLLKGASEELKFNNIDFDVLYAPGCFEIPFLISKNINKYQGFIALGCVIRGQTPHFDFISKSTTDALMTLSITAKKPVGNGVITCLNKKQAVARGKKGSEAAEAVLSVLFQ